MSTPWLYIGLVLRALVLYLGVFGITSFIVGAAGLSYSPYWQEAVVTPGTTALLCIPIAVACAIASMGTVFAIATPILYAGAVIGIYAINYGNPFSFIWFSILRVYNYALNTVSSAGYYQFSNFIISDGYDYSKIASYDPYRFAGVFILASIIGLILYFCIQKKTRLIPLVILFTIVIGPILTYNLAEGNSGIAFIIVFICGALALKVYDYRYGGKAEAVLKNKKLKAEKKSEKELKRKKKLEEKEALRAEADRVFDKAIDADMPLKKAKQARAAVYKNHKDAKKAARENEKLAKRLEKKNLAKANKERKARIKDLKKQLSKAPKGSSERERILASINAQLAVLNEKKIQKQDRLSKLRIEKKEAARKSRRISMAGGFAGIGVALIAFLAVWLPLALAKEPFAVIKPINDRVQTIRAYVTAYLRGSDVDLNDPYVYGLDLLAPRDLSFEPLELEDRTLFSVQAKAMSNIYMRSWAATEFDWVENKWYSGSYPDLYRYRERFGNSFTPDSIKTDFYSYVYPSSTVIEDEHTYKNFSKYGFTVQQINVWRSGGQSLLIFVPSHMNTNAGLLEYGTLSKLPYTYQNYFDGTYSSFHIRYGRGYSTISYVTAYNRVDTAHTIDDSLLYYSLCADAITAAPNASDEEARAIVDEIEWTLQEMGIEYLGASIADRYYFSMSTEEQKKYLADISTEKDYREYVLETYTDKSEIESIANIATEIKDNAVAKELEEGKDGSLTRHEAALAVVDYFRSGEFTYTETPNKDLAKGNKPVIQSFLTEVKQGYCSHFASAAVFLLREMDIPARYVEGYVASDLESEGINTGRYSTEITGTDAHAWIEVYMDGIGWMQYEVSPGQLCDDMYDPNSDTVPPEIEETEDEEDEEPEEDESSDPMEVPETPPKPPVSEETDEELDGGFESDLQLFIMLLIIALIVAAVAAAVYFVIRYIRKRAWTAMNARYAVIDTAKNRDAFIENSFDKHSHAKSIIDWILDVYALIGCEPRPGELPSEFVTRMREDYKDLSKVDVGDVIDAMQKEEFGHGLNYDELNLCAEYLEDIISSVYAGMNPWQKLVNRYFRRKI